MMETQLERERGEALKEDAAEELREQRRLSDLRGELDRFAAGNEQTGCVLVFKPGTTASEASAALSQIGALIDRSYYAEGWPTIETFDPRDGGPVWYLP